MFVVKLKDAYEKSGKSMYRVMRDTGLARNTVALYALNESVRVKMIYDVVVQLAEYYGVNWKDVVSYEYDAMENHPEKKSVTV